MKTGDIRGYIFKGITNESRWVSEDHVILGSHVDGGGDKV
jgi:hypothetical protein